MTLRFRPGDRLDLRPDKTGDGQFWMLTRRKEELARVLLRGTRSPLIALGDRELVFDPCARRSIVLWERSTGQVECWVRSRRRPWVADVVFPDERDDELRLIRGPLRSPRLVCADRRRLARFEFSQLRGDPIVHVDVGEPADLSSGHAVAVLAAASVLLLDELGMQPAEDRARSDIGWEYRADGGIFGGMFGGDGGGGGGGDGGGGGGGGS